MGVPLRNPGIDDPGGVKNCKPSWGGTTAFSFSNLPIIMRLETSIEIVKISIPILDETVSESDFQETIDDLENGKELNGYYCGKVGIFWSGDDLMLKYE